MFSAEKKNLKKIIYKNNNKYLSILISKQQKTKNWFQILIQSCSRMHN